MKYQSMDLNTPIAAIKTKPTSVGKFFSQRARLTAIYHRQVYLPKIDAPKYSDIKNHEFK